MSESWVAAGKSRKVLAAVLLKVSVYYFVVFGLVYVLSTSFSAFLDGLPVGGVSDLSGGADLEISQLEEVLLSGEYDENELDAGAFNSNADDPASRFLFDDARALLFSMFGCILLMLPVSWVYKAIHREGEHDHYLDETTLILPAVVAGIVMIVQHSLALAFSLAGIVAGVQFRRALSDTFDTLFIFVAIAVGISAGIRALDIAAVLTVFFCYSTLFVCIFGDGLESQHVADKKQQKAQQKLQKSQLETNTQETNNPD